MTSNLTSQKTASPKRTKYILTALAVILTLGVLSSASVIQVAAATPIIDLRPDMGTVNRIVTISNRGGFKADANITIKFDGKVIASTVSNSSGGFLTTFKVPQSVVGTQTVSATDGTNVGTKTFKVVTNLAIVPKSGHVGRTVKINGTGFASMSSVKITFDSKVVDTTKSNETGGFTTSITVPDNPAGSYPIVATDAKGDSASSTFTIMT